jgi:hypothetical protein
MMLSIKNYIQFFTAVLISLIALHMPTVMVDIGTFIVCTRASLRFFLLVGTLAGDYRIRNKKKFNS